MLKSNNLNTESVGVICLPCKNKDGFQICHFNAQSLSPKIDEFRHIFEKSGDDVICVSETRLKSNKSDSLLKVNGYNVVRTDRISHAAGVAMFVKSSIPFKFICMSPCDSDVIIYMCLLQYLQWIQKF